MYAGRMISSANRSYTAEMIKYDFPKDCINTSDVRDIARRCELRGEGQKYEADLGQRHTLAVEEPPRGLHVRTVGVSAVSEMIN